MAQGQKDGKQIKIFIRIILVFPVFYRNENKDDLVSSVQQVFESRY